MLWVTPGLAIEFLTPEGHTYVLHKVNGYGTADMESAVSWTDPDLIVASLGLRPLRFFGFKAAASGLSAAPKS